SSTVMSTTTSTIAPPPSTTSTTLAPSTTLPPQPSLPAAPAAEIWIGDTSEQAVSLTFDAGSDAGNTSTILDVLGSYGIRATFALTGEWVEQNPELATRIVVEGHVVMNHSYDHPSFTGVSSDDVVLTTA